METINVEIDYTRASWSEQQLFYSHDWSVVFFLALLLAIVLAILIRYSKGKKKQRSNSEIHPITNQPTEPSEIDELDDSLDDELDDERLTLSTDEQDATQSAEQETETVIRNWESLPITVSDDNTIKIGPISARFTLDWGTNGNPIMTFQFVALKEETSDEPESAPLSELTPAEEIQTNQ